MNENDFLAAWDKVVLICFALGRDNTLRLLDALIDFAQTRYTKEELREIRAGVIDHFDGKYPAPTETPKIV